MNISYGNPRLQPALAHVFSLAYSTMLKKTSININVFHQFSNNAIQQITTIGTDTIALTTFSNIGQNKNLSFAVSSNTTVFRKLNFNVNSIANYVQYTRIIEGKPQRNQGLTYSLSCGANIRLKQWQAGSNLNYSAPIVMVQGKTAHFISNSINFNRYFGKKNNITIGIALNNPFQAHRRSIVEIDDPTFYQLRQSSIQVRRYNLSLNYRFTKVQKGTTSKHRRKLEQNLEKLEAEKTK
jgi:hypothetical protein